MTRFTPGFLGATMAMLLVGPPAQAQTSSAMVRCASIADPRARLACYDAASGHPDTAAAPSQDGYPEFTTPPRAAGLFSSERAQRSPPAEARPANGRIVADVTRYTLAGGRFTVYLDNGQVWHQLDSDSGRAEFRQSGNRVVITPGFWHSYDLKLNTMSAGFKVDRDR